MEAPLSRVEAILQNILGADNVLVPPQSRVEAILLAILNNTEYIHPGDPSRVEEILLAIKDGGSYDKKALSRVEDILIHKLNDEEYTDYSEDDLSRVEKLLIQWIDLHPEVIKELTASSFPISILANGSPLLDYRIDGNTVQNGTPTPDNPIEPEFVGDLVSIELDEPLRTVGDYKDTLDLWTKTKTYKIPISSGGVNLFDPENCEVGKQLNGSGEVNNISFAVMTDYIESSGHSAVTLEQLSTTANTGWAYYIAISAYDADKVHISRSYIYNQKDQIHTTLTKSLPDNTKYIRASIILENKSPLDPILSVQPMLSWGTEALPYEPYVTPTVKNIYLGQVQTTRRIKKFVLTGKEAWQKSGVGYNGFYFNGYTKQFTDMFCNIAVAGTRSEYAQRPWVTYNDGFVEISTDPEIVGTTVASFESWLAERYANGNPVIVWAIRSSDIVGTVNEPLCRIEDYADSVDFSQAGVEIPTLKKPNTTVIDVETEVEPSSMYLKYSEPSDGPAPKTPVLGTKDREIYVTPNNKVYVLRR